MACSIWPINRFWGCEAFAAFHIKYLTTPRPPKKENTRSNGTQIVILHPKISLLWCSSPCLVEIFSNTEVPTAALNKHKAKMRSSIRFSASTSDLHFYLVSTSDTIALSFGFASTLIAIVTVFATRRAYHIPCSYPSSNPNPSNTSKGLTIFWQQLGISNNFHLPVEYPRRRCKRIWWWKRCA